MKGHYQVAVTLFLLAFATAVMPQSQPVIVTDTRVPVADHEKTLNIRTDQGSSCTAAPAGICGTCSVSCPVGKAAACRPGKVIGQSGEPQSCLQPPSCKCD